MKALPPQTEIVELPPTEKQDSVSDQDSCSSGEVASLLFPGWTSPPDPCPNLESCEIGKPYCWEYDFSWRNTLSAYEKIQSKLERQAVEGIIPSPGISQFWDSIRAAHTRIYFYDRHFGPSDLCRVLQVLKHRQQFIDAGTIKFLIIANLAEQAGEFKRQFLRLLNSKEHLPARIDISILSTNGDDQVHDRFALVDNNIWHFGVKVGSMHKSISACSGPWKDENERMRKFFHDLVHFFKDNDSIGVPFEMDRNEIDNNSLP